MENNRKIEVSNDEDIRVKIVKKCGKCGQLLDENAKDCWKCSSKNVVEVAEEDTPELEENELLSKVNRLEAEVKNVKFTNTVLFIMAIAIAVLMFLK